MAAVADGRASAFASMSMTFAQRESMSVKLPRTLRCEVSRFLAATIYALVALSGLSMSTAAEDGPVRGVKTPPREGGKAQAETAPENKFRAVLPDGATFELVGVGDAADDKAWWHGDGSPRTRPHYLTQFQFAKIPTPFPQTTENRIKRRFVLVCKHNGDASVTEPAIVGETKESSAGSSTIAFLGVKQTESTLSVVILPQSRATVRLKYAAGKWTTVATCPPTRGTAVATPQGGVLFGNPTENEGGTQLPVAVNSDAEDYRFVAVDKASREHDSVVGVTSTVAGIRLLTPFFRNLRLDRIQEFHLQTAQLA